MNRREINLSGMYLTLEEFLVTNLSSFEGKQVILDFIEELKSQNAKIRSLNAAQSISTKADFVIKGEDKSLLIDTAIKVSEGMKVIAAANKDTRLKVDASGISRWDLGHMRENDMLVRLNQLYLAAVPFASEMLPLGISNDEIESLSNDKNKLVKTNPVISNIKVKTAQATTELGQTIVETNTSIRETLDPLMLQFKNLNPTLYGEYLNARKIVARPAGHSSKGDTTK